MQVHRYTVECVCVYNTGLTVVINNKYQKKNPCFSNSLQKSNLKWNRCTDLCFSYSILQTSFLTRTNKAIFTATYNILFFCVQCALS